LVWERRYELSAFALVAALLLTWLGGCERSSARPPGAVKPTALLPVVACPTTHGTPGHYPPRFPERVATSLQPTLAAQLAYFTDDQRVLAPILAPRAWHCHAFDYVDGGAKIRVAPVGAPPDSVVAVVAEADHACVGCAWELICTLLPNAATELHYNPYNCPTKAEGEQVSWIRGSPAHRTRVDDVVSFVDPPGVKGTGMPSGGVVAARGLLMYRAHPGKGRFAAIETCALPAVDRALCAAILTDFQVRAWGLS
jgi:hypothetical protein